MTTALPIVYIGADHDDFSIFHFAIQDINPALIVVWYPSHHPFLENPIACRCVVLDIPDKSIVSRLIVEPVSGMIKDRHLPLYVFTALDLWEVKPLFQQVDVAGFIPKMAQFDLLTEYLREHMNVA